MVDEYYNILSIRNTDYLIKQFLILGLNMPCKSKYQEIITFTEGKPLGYSNKV